LLVAPPCGRDLSWVLDLSTKITTERSFHNNQEEWLNNGDFNGSWERKKGRKEGRKEGRKDDCKMAR